MAKKKTDRIDKRAGVKMYGLHFEFITYHYPPNPETGFYLRSQVQMFLVNNRVYVYERMAGNKTARWETTNFDNHESARLAMRAILATADTQSAYSVELLGVPTLVQLAESDALAVKNGLKPSARYDGGLRNTRLQGKIDDATWRPSNVT